MKDKIGFNLLFAILAFPIGIALFKDTAFSPFAFKKPVLDTLYFVTFLGLIVLMFKKQKKDSDK